MKPILENLGLVTVGTEQAFAVTSPDDRYRYILGRFWEDYFGSAADWWDRELIWTFCMLNPSRARVDDDATVRQCVGFAKRGGAGGLLIVNGMAYSTPYPDELVEAHERGEDVCGSVNAEVIAWATGRPGPPGVRVAAWGIVPARLRDISQKGRAAFLSTARVHCLGKTKDGWPRHPLRLPYTTKLEPMTAEAA